MFKFIVEEGAKVPELGSQYSAGFDIHSLEDFTLGIGEQKMIRTGIKLAGCPLNSYLRIAPRSKLANKFGVTVLAGVVDADYRGEICVILQRARLPTQMELFEEPVANTATGEISFSKGDAIAQLIPTIIPSRREISIQRPGETLFKKINTPLKNQAPRGKSGIKDDDTRL